jgi:hypothetical protein
MKPRRFIAVPLVLLFALAAIPASAWSATPFRGTWKGTDPFDGSTIRMRITERLLSYGKVFEINAVDDRTGDWCSTNGAGQMSAIGVLQESGDLAVSFVWWCLPPGHGIYPTPGSEWAFDWDIYTYDQASGTITDRWGTVYQRVQ